MSTAEFKVTGMHCPSCPMLISMELEELSGVESASVDLSSGKATVTFDPDKVDTSSILATIAKAGYQAELAA